MWVSLCRSGGCFSFRTESQGEPDNTTPLWTLKSQLLKTVNGTTLWKINEVLQKTNIHVFLLPTTSLHRRIHRYKVVVNLKKKSLCSKACIFFFHILGETHPAACAEAPCWIILPLLPRREQGELCTGTQHRVCAGELWAESSRATVPCIQRTNILT